MIYNYDTYNENKIPTDTISSPNIFLEDLIIFNRDMDNIFTNQGNRNRIYSTGKANDEIKDICEIRDIVSKRKQWRPQMISISFSKNRAKYEL